MATKNPQESSTLRDAVKARYSGGPNHWRRRAAERKLAQPAGNQAFVTVFRPYRTGRTLKGKAHLEEIPGGLAVTVPLSDGETRILLLTEPGASLSGAGIATDGEVGAMIFDAEGKVRATFVAAGETIEAR